MQEFLNKVTVGEYNLFRQKVMERTHWSRTQYNDRKIGRIKISPLERDVLEQVLEEMPSQQLLRQYSKLVREQ